jgi:MurNAc alpha-1-phosphate uridylyltransferase
MVFAAGLGTRLRPTTDSLPKAPVEGVAMLERTARRMVAAGCERLVVNAHAFPDAIEDFVRAKRGFGVEIVVVRESPAPLETGGGLVHARRAFRGDGPILLHNADVLSEIDLRALVAAHRARGAVATLAVASRETSRRLLFDDAGLLGRVDDVARTRETARPPKGAVVEAGFAGVHVVERSFVDAIEERGVFSILVPYLRAAGRGAAVLPHRVDGAPWIDIGRPADLERAHALARTLDAPGASAG